MATMKFEQHDIKWDSDKINRFWNFISTNVSLSNQFFGLNAGKHVASIINKALKMKRLSNIIDISCGKGDILCSLLPFLNHGQSIYGTDFSEENIKDVNNRLKNSRQFQKALILREYPSPFSEEFFDLVIMTEIIEHLDDKELKLTLDEANRMLKKGGYLFITAPYSEDLDAKKIMCPDCGCVFHIWQHRRSWTPDTLQKKMKEYCFYTRLLKTMTLSSSLKERFVFKLAKKANLMKPKSILYLGEKQA